MATAVLVVACSYSSIYDPHSSPATVGDAFAYSVYVRCGFRQSLFDIDGSLWTPIDVSDDDMRKPPSGFDAPDDRGTLTLVAADRAEYRSSQGRVVALRRHTGALEIRSSCD